MDVKMSSNSDGSGPARASVSGTRPTRRLGLTTAGIAMAVAGPGLVTLLALLPSRPRPTVPALLYLLVVVAAAAAGGLWPGLAASALSFLALDVFFTPPFGTLTVRKVDDVVALVVFLAVAATVSLAISAVLAQRATAEARERQVRALYQVTARLLSGAAIDDVLADLADAIRGVYRVPGCRILIADADGSVRERARSGEADAKPAFSVPLLVGGDATGRIELAGTPAEGLSAPEEEVLKTFAGQLALALEGTRLGEEAAEARFEAEANRVRAALFSSVTHDLRTPLASIKASASSLLEEGVPFSWEQRAELLRTILEETERLNRLVGNLMDLSRMRAGALVPSPEPVLLEDVVWSVLRRLHPLLDGRPVRVRIREDVPPVSVDVVQMDQVLSNLLENAVRYSPPATEISVTAVRWQHAVEVRVADRGPGIPAGERGRVFEEFYRRDVEGRRGGTGLGLAIARAVVQGHGGTIGIEETPGGGTTVVVRLPLPAPAPTGPSGDAFGEGE